jgi:hypothetical protein
LIAAAVRANCGFDPTIIVGEYARPNNDEEAASQHISFTDDDLLILSVA